MIFYQLSIVIFNQLVFEFTLVLFRPVRTCPNYNPTVCLKVLAISYF